MPTLIRSFSNKKIISGTVASVIIPVALFFGASSTPPSAPKPPCRVDMSNTHESSFFAKKFKVLSVKANTSVICDKPISHVIVYINLYKRALLGPTLLKRFTSQELPYLPAGKRIKISGPFVVCTNWKETEFFSTVSSTAVMDGKPVRAPWRRSFAQKIACGT
jgi:hypothetical protein